MSLRGNLGALMLGCLTGLAMMGWGIYLVSEHEGAGWFLFLVGIVIGTQTLSRFKR